MSMDNAQALLSELHQARLDRLKEICAEHGLSRNGSVEVLRARLIAELVLTEWDLTPEGAPKILNKDLGDILAVFGIKKSGSIRERRQRLYLHLNHDAKQLTPEKLESRSRDELHELCAKLDLPRSGTKQALLMRVAGVLMSQMGSWGVIKKSLRRPRGAAKVMMIPSPSEEDEEMIEYENSSETEDVEVVLSEVIVEEIVDEVIVSDEVEVIEHTPAPIAVTAPIPEVVEITTNVMEMEGRIAEIDALCRDYLLVGDISDHEDVEAFISSLSSHGLPVGDSNAASFVKNRLIELDSLARSERDAMHSMPNSWREREALRKFEEARGVLRESLPQILSDTGSDMVKARMAFEELGRELGLDLRLPSVSGRLHAIFDLQISLDEEVAASDPRTARRTRVLRILQHGAVHLHPSERRTLDRLERNMDGFEQLVETILEKSDSNYGEAEQALIVRFLEKKGYEINTPDLRPRVVAAAGVVGAELGHISPADIPRLAPGIKVSEVEVDSIITDLKRLANQFKPKDSTEQVSDEEETLAESVSDAADRVATMRQRLDGVDDLLARLRISR